MPQSRELQAAQVLPADAVRRAAEARLAKLRAGSRPQEVAGAKAALKAAQAALTRLQRGNRPEEIQRPQAALQVEQEELAKLRAGPRPQEIAQAEAAVREAQSDAEAAAKEVERVGALFTDGLASGKDRERAGADRTAAQAHLATAQEQVKLLREGTRAEEIRAQEAKVRAAEADLKLALAATVTLPHLPGVSFRTTVSTIGALNNTDTGLVPLELLVPNGSHELKEGRAADVSLVLTAHEQALQVPLAAVFGRAGESFVYVVDSESQVHERRVELGVERDEKAHQRAS
ncbi:MAG: hypothetical protein CO096_30215 [Armatimonadetes bacterium CG_4_9_14_3_um_filter_66_14]|nr:MAG: hypothetical protein CO096_30215 [Armatimonadetes bacterium CG_4_9_14_3_um_filter_66_14]